jgi:AcrR family transcriptional regulator
MSTGTQTENRRERRKRQTRAAIVAAARELFVEKGFDQTTLSEIAERADVASSTLFTHFSTKAEIFFADYHLFVQDHIRILETRDREHESAIEATMRWHREVADHVDFDPQWLNQLRRIVDENPLLTAMEYQQYEPSVSVLVREVAYDLGASERDLLPRLVASVKVGLYFTLSRYLSQNAMSPEESEKHLRYVDECLSAAAAAIEAVPVPRVVGSHENGLPALPGPMRDSRSL